MAALILAIEKRRPDLAARLLGAGANPFLMPAGIHHLLPLPLSPGMGTAADRAMAALLEVDKQLQSICVDTGRSINQPPNRLKYTITQTQQDARQAPQRVALLKRCRCMTDAAHAAEKILAGPVTNTNTPDQEPPPPLVVVDVVESGDAALLPKLLAAAPPELRTRVESAAAAGGTPGAAFGQTVLAALPHADLVADETDGLEEEEAEGNAATRQQRRLRATARFVALDGGLKPELFVELMAMMTFSWFARVWEAEGGEEQGL
jgi:hypothetical protein